MKWHLCFIGLYTDSHLIYPTHVFQRRGPHSSVNMITHMHKFQSHGPHTSYISEHDLYLCFSKRHRITMIFGNSRIGCDIVYEVKSIFCFDPFDIFLSTFSFDQVNVDMEEMTNTPDSEPRITISDPANNSPNPNSCCGGRNFDCIEKRLRQLFAAWGRIVARHPWPVFILPILVTMALSSGFLFLVMETNQEVLYTPINGQAKTDRKIVEDLFKSVSWEAHTTPARLTHIGRFVQVIFTRNDDKNVLESELLDKAFDVHDMVLSHKLKNSKGVSFEYEDLCIMWHGSCLANSVLTLYEDNLDFLAEDNITYPYTFLPDGNVGFVGSELGGVELWDEDEFEPEFSPVKLAKSFRLLYYLKSDGEYDEVSKDFEYFVMHAVKEMSADWKDISAIPFASRTFDDEVKAATFESMTYFPVAAVLLLIFTVSWSNSCIIASPPLSLFFCCIFALSSQKYDVTAIIVPFSAVYVLIFCFKDPWPCCQNSR